MKITNARARFLLGAILVVAAIARFEAIDQPFVDAYSWREASTAMMAENFFRGRWNIFYPEISWDGPGPSYNGRELQTVSYLAALLYTVFGQHDWIGRSIAVCFGLWGIFALYQLTSLVWDRERGLLAAAVMAVIPGSVFVDREFLPDPAMVALITTSAWFFVRYCQTERLRYLVLASSIGAWGVLSKLTGAIVAIPMIYAGVTILGGRRRLDRRRLFPLAIATLLALVPVVAYYLWARYLALNYPPFHFAGAGSWLWDHGFLNWLGEKYYLPRLYSIFNSWFWKKPVIALVLAGLILRPPYRSREGENPIGKAPWFFHWWLVGMGLYYLIGCKHLIDQPYNFHLINPPAAALSGHALATLAAFLKRRFSFPVALAGVLVILLTVRGYGYRGLRLVYHPFVEPSYRLGLELRALAKPDDLVLSIADEVGNPVMIYYSRRRGWIFPPAWSEIPWWDDLPSGEDRSLIAMLEDLRERGADWIGIAASQYEKLPVSNPRFIEYLDRNFELKYRGESGLIYFLPSPTEVRSEPSI